MAKLENWFINNQGDSVETCKGVDFNSSPFFQELAKFASYYLDKSGAKPGGKGYVYEDNPKYENMFEMVTAPFADIDKILHQLDKIKSACRKAASRCGAQIVGTGVPPGTDKWTGPGGLDTAAPCKIKNSDCLRRWRSGSSTVQFQYLALIVSQSKRGKYSKSSNHWV